MNFIKRLDEKLKGAPEGALTLILLGIAAIAIYIAFVGSPTVKAAAAIWFVMP
jgi:hypothetical protein